jgi:hypothetical protein
VPAEAQPHTVPLTPDAVSGPYQLTRIAWIGDAPESALPAWTWPGRVLVLAGRLELDPDGSYMTSTSERGTLFGDTTFFSTSASGTWALRSDSTVRFMQTGTSTVTEARADGRALLWFGGLLNSTGTRFRYER